MIEEKYLLNFFFFPSQWFFTPNKLPLDHRNRCIIALVHLSGPYRAFKFLVYLYFASVLYAVSLQACALLTGWPSTVQYSNFSYCTVNSFLKLLLTTCPLVDRNANIPLSTKTLLANGFLEYLQMSAILMLSSFKAVQWRTILYNLPIII